MKKTIHRATLACLLTLLAPTLYCGIPSSIYHERTDIEKEGLKGKVKSVNQTEYNGQKPSGVLVKREVLGYNDTKYDEYGYAVENRARRYDEEMNYEIATTYVNKYNTDGKRVEWCAYNDKDTLLVQHIYKYNSKGDIIEHAVYKPKGRLNLKYKFEYDSKRNIVNSYTYNSYETITNHYTFDYDKNGNMVESNGYYDAESRSSTLIYKYDEKGNIVEQIFFNSIVHEEATQTRWKNIYDEKGNLTEAYLLSPMDSFEKKYLYKHNAKGDITEEYVADYVNDTEVTQQYEYKYDKHGNWIQIVTATSSKETSIPYIEIKERVIEYYE